MIEVGDVVEDWRTGEEFLVKQIFPCDGWDGLCRKAGCPGAINSPHGCYNFATKGFVLKLLGKGNINNDIIMQK